MPQFPVSQPVGTRVYGPVTFQNDTNQALVQFTAWGNTATVLDMLVEVTMDAGATWQTVANGAGFTGGGTGRFANPSMRLGPIPLICDICGNLYLPGFAAYSRALSHSTVTLNPGVTFADIAAAVGYPVTSVADIQLRILVDAAGNDVDARFVTRTFHTPIPDPQAPLRRLRVTATVTGAPLNTVLDVTLSA